MIMELRPTNVKTMAIITSNMIFYIEIIFDKIGSLVSMAITVKRDRNRIEVEERKRERGFVK